MKAAGQTVGGSERAEDNHRLMLKCRDPALRIGSAHRPVRRLSAVAAFARKERPDGSGVQLSPASVASYEPAKVALVKRLHARRATGCHRHHCHPSRRAAARHQCGQGSGTASAVRNHLRQLGLAANAYHSAHRHLPPGWLGNTYSDRPQNLHRAQNVGALVYLLPYLDEKALFDRIKVDLNVKTVAPHWYTDNTMQQLAMTRLSLFICPADTPYESDGVWCAFATYHQGSFPRSTASQSSLDLGRTNYVGMAGRFGSTGVEECDVYQGVFTNRSQTRLEHVKDGTSKTLMFGEVYGQKGKDSYRPEPQDYARFDFNYSWMGIGALPIFSVGTSGTFIDDIVFTTRWRSSHTFNSEHIGIIYFCFADGSVKPLEKDIDFDILVELGGMSDSVKGVSLETR